MSVGLKPLGQTPSGSDPAPRVRSNSHHVVAEGKSWPRSAGGSCSTSRTSVRPHLAYDSSGADSLGAVRNRPPEASDAASSPNSRGSSGGSTFCELEKSTTQSNREPKYENPKSWLHSSRGRLTSSACSGISYAAAASRLSTWESIP